MKDIELLLSEMTLEEKAALCTGATAWTTTPITRLEIPRIQVADGPHGIRKVVKSESLGLETLAATCFPTASCLASSWNLDLVYEMGQAIAEEAIALDVDIVLGPGVNMKRIPICGRNFEYYSEDPFLAGEMAASFINGVQKMGVGTSLKHFAANNQETLRMTIDARIDERTLHEIYLSAFEIAVKKAQPWTVMCAYNRLNEVYGSENRCLITEILRNQWGFEGFVVSDWGAVHDRVKSLQAGLDLEMPGPKERHVQEIIDAVRSGQLAETFLDDAVRRILRIVSIATRRVKAKKFDSATHHALARRIAGEGIVLLKNNGILPLKNVTNIAVIGRSAKEAHFQGGGSSRVNPTNVDIPLEELAKLAGNAHISYCEGYPADDSTQSDMITRAVEAANASEIALLFVALPTYKEAEGYDRSDLSLTDQQIKLIQSVTASQLNTVVILNNGSAVTMNSWIGGAAAVLEGWMMGQAGGGAIADILFGYVNPSGKLAETFPNLLSDTPAYINFPGEQNIVRYGEGMFIGYRYYDARHQPVLFPFGYGKSYTTFLFSNPSVSQRNFQDIDGVTISLDVTNTGSLPGKETVQVYVHDKLSSLVRPEKELKGFVKVELQPSETRRVSIHLDCRAFAFYHPGYGQWITESGEFDLLVGSSSAEIHIIEQIVLKSTLKLPCILDSRSSINDWLHDPHGKDIFEPVYKMIIESSHRKEILTYLMDLPLIEILELPGVTTETKPQAILEQLLKQVQGG